MKFVNLKRERTHPRDKLDEPSRAALESFTKPVAVPHHIHTYTELRQQIHDDLRIQHPEWVQSNGECPSAIRMKRASWNCSAFRREGDPTSLSQLLIATPNTD